MEKKRKYRCASCGNIFESGEKDNNPSCPECRSKTLILIEGEPKRKKGCAPSG